MKHRRLKLRLPRVPLPRQVGGAHRDNRTRLRTKAERRDRLHEGRDA
jgi:hypothetical protein